MVKPVGNKLHRARLRKVINGIHRKWALLVNDAQLLQDEKPFYRIDERQSLRDILQSFLVEGFITDYTVEKVTFSEEIQS